LLIQQSGGLQLLARLSYSPACRTVHQDRLTASIHPVTLKTPGIVIESYF